MEKYCAKQSSRGVLSNVIQLTFGEKSLPKDNGESRDVSASRV